MNRPGTTIAGYTIAEVMISLGLLAIGATGVIATQKVTLIGNNQARNIATANAIAQSWAERLRAESLQWNAPNGIDDLGTDTQWLKFAAANNPVWFNPAEVAAGGTSPSGTPRADVIGGDVFKADTTAAAFCTKIRLTRLLIFPNPDANDPSTTRTIRAEIRVFWEREGKPVVCSAVPDPETGDNKHLGFVSLITAVIQNSAP